MEANLWPNDGIHMQAWGLWFDFIRGEFCIEFTPPTQTSFSTLWILSLSLYIKSHLPLTTFSQDLLSPTYSCPVFRSQVSFKSSTNPLLIVILWIPHLSLLISGHSDLVTIVYPPGCREVTDDLGPDELIRRLKTLAHTFQTLSQVSETGPIGLNGYLERNMIDIQ